MNGSNPRGDGEPRVCLSCKDPFRLVGVLPLGGDIEYCPTCFEEYLNR